VIAGTMNTDRWRFLAEKPEVQDEINAVERSFVSNKIAGGQHNSNALADAVFFRRHPERVGRLIRQDETQLGKEWLAILRDIEPILSGGLPAASVARRSGVRDPDVVEAQVIASRTVPGMPGVTIEQLVEKWRRRIIPEVPLSVLLAFIRFESAGFDDATHGTPRDTPPFSQPANYELGLFQTPGGGHGVCTTGSFKSCAIPPPGRENPKDLSPWARLCCDGADCSNCGPVVTGSSHNWTDPDTQARVGLLDLKQGADRIRAAFPDLFPTPGSDWDLRAAVLLRFAGGGGFVEGLLRRNHADLAPPFPENRRWELLRSRQITIRGKAVALGSTKVFGNVNNKMALAAKLGYRP
jgi:hypothetical protein